MSRHSISYSDKYFDDTFEYRHVILPSDVARLLPRGRLLSDTEWRSVGVTQSRGWVHYAIHRPEPHIMLFRRPLGYVDPATTTITPTATASAATAPPPPEPQKACKQEEAPVEIGSFTIRWKFRLCRDCC